MKVNETKYIPNDPCPNCNKAHLTYEAGTPATYYDEGAEPILYCEECDYEAEIEWDAWNVEKQVFWRLTDAQKERLNALEKRIEEVYPQPTKENACSWKDVFKHAPEGTFKWEAEEAGDWTPSLMSLGRNTQMVTTWDAIKTASVGLNDGSWTETEIGT